jgi:HEAT repeat protein
MRRFIVTIFVAIAWPQFCLDARAEFLDLRDLPKYIAALNAPKRSARLDAMAAIGRYGMAGKGAVADLARILREDKDDIVANRAGQALAQIGMPAVATLEQILSDDAKIAVRVRAASALGMIGVDARDASSVLLKALRDPSDVLRVVAAQALAEVRPQSKDATQELLAALNDRNPQVRLHVKIALGMGGPEVLAELKTALTSDSAQIRQDAIHVAGQFGSQAKEAVPVLIDAIKDSDDGVRLASLSALATMGGDAKDAVPNLIEAMKSKHFATQQGAFQAIMAIANASDDPTSILNAMQEMSRQHRWAMPYVLKQFGSKAKDAVKPLVKGLQDKDPNVRMGAAMALGQLGETAKEAAPALRESIAKDPYLPARSAAGMALIRIEPKNQDPTYKKALLGLQMTMQQMNAESANPKANYYNTVVTTFVTSMSSFPPTGSCGDLNEVQRSSRRLVLQIDSPDFVPALVRGLNMVGYYDIGFS